MIRIVLRTMILLAAGILPAALLAQSPKEKETPIAKEFPLKDLKPEMVCYANTIFRGEKPRKVKVKIVKAVDHPEFPDASLILATLQNRIPVVAGMSGSPVYCGDHKLLGALSMRIGNFPLKDFSAGVTPIGYMRDQLTGLGRGTAPPYARAMDLNQIENLPFIHVALFSSGSMKGELRAQKIGPVHAGDSVTIFLARGSFSMGGTCTVTEVTPTTFSACGHQILGQGVIDFPAYRSSVAMTVESADQSFKMVGDILEPVGTIVYDNVFAVNGVREMRSDVMVPVNLSIQAGSNHYRYQFEVIRHNFYTPALIAKGIYSLAATVWSETQIGTAKLAAKIYLKGRDDPIEVSDTALITQQLTHLGSVKGDADAWQILTKFQQTLNAIQESEWKLNIQRVELELSIEPGNHLLMFDSMAVLNEAGQPTDEIHPGEKLTVILGMRSADSLQKRVRSFTLEIPRDLNLVKPDSDSTTYLPAKLILVSGTRYQELDPKKLPKAEPESAEQFLSILNLNQKSPSEIFALLLLPPEYQRKQGVKMLPHLKPDVWNSVDPELVRNYATASESRVIRVALGEPTKDAALSFFEERPLRLILK